MKVLIVGGGPSGILTAIEIKKNNPSFEVILLEKEERLGKKIYVSGNGRCNLFNYETEDNLYNCYRYPELAKEIIIPEEILKTFYNLGLDIRKENDLGYPYTEQARTVMDVFNFHIKNLNIDVRSKTELIDYFIYENKITVITTNEKIDVDYLIIASGGKSSSIHGSNGMLFSILKKHGYLITPLYPGLTAIKVKEDLTSLKGTRVKAKISLIKDNIIIANENGEIQFKEDALGGIAIMNMSSIIARLNIDGYFKLSLDLFPQFSEEQLFEHFIDKQRKGYPYLDGSIISGLARFIENRTSTRGRKNEQELRKVVNQIKHLEFTFDSLYPFNNSQVTVGGLSILELNNDLSSKKEKNIYFVGEVIDNDGLCGGFNLMWCFATALKVSKSIK